MPVKHPGPSFAEMLPVMDSIRNTVDLNDPATLWAAFNSYMNLCCNTGLYISNRSMYYCCGTSKETINAWYHRTRRAHDPQYHDFAEMVKTICAAAREQYGVEGQTSPLMTIWLQKAFDGFRDDPPDEAVLNPLGDIDKDRLERLYGGLE